MTLAPAEPIGRLAWDPWGRCVVGAALDGSLWSVARDGDVEALGPGAAPVTALDWAPDGSDLAVGSLDGHLRIGPPGDPPRLTMRFRGSVGTLAWSPDATALAIGAGSDVVVIDADGGLIDEFCFLPGAVQSLCWAPGPGNLAAGCVGGIHWLDVGGEGPAEPVVIDQRAGAVTTLRLDPRRRFLAVGDLRGAVEVIDLWGGVTSIIDDLPDRVRRLVWSPDSDRLAVAVDDMVVVWPRDHEGLGPDAEVAITHDDLVSDADLHPGGKWLASAGLDGCVAVTDLDTGNRQRTVNTAEPVRSVAWSPDGELLAFGSTSRGIILVGL